ncbi:hypothetical protein [Ureibacillus aquaedulcis]|uniref:Uncharacterized protein n=1 Tax=Ureibacillus aquaedulcis TaxID=3058421 RepID=A0ABT8GTL8_9BACL|nr:hypothetical protein [Ureibacillus sp. BA0131]MDN4494766.1 hypothetical protein [Ureibacillus sp. BA0131]
MRKNLYAVMCLLCSLVFMAGCTDNGDETPVEAKSNVKETKTTDSSDRINSLLKEV